MSLAIVPDWTRVRQEPFSLRVPDGVTNPVLTAADVTDVPATGVADPFLFRENDTWHMFFEILASDGTHIGHATSSDGLHWSYDRTVLHEDETDTHMAYPLVLEHDGSYYMIPDPGAQSQVWVYQASDFPYSWRRIGAIAGGRRFVDPSIFVYRDSWWMFVGGGADCYLYFSDHLTSGWTEHPASPIVRNDRSTARPAGQPLVFDGDRIVRIAQKCDVSYGEQVRAFEVETLTRESYAEHEIPQSPLFKRTGTGWNSDAVHHFGPWWAGDHWLVGTDGNSPDGWAIGLYVTPSIREEP